MSNSVHKIALYLRSSLSLLYVILTEFRNLSREMHCKIRINGQSGKSKIDYKLKIITQRDSLIKTKRQINLKFHDITKI